MHNSKSNQQDHQDRWALHKSRPYYPRRSPIVIYSTTSLWFQNLQGLKNSSSMDPERLFAFNQARPWPTNSTPPWWDHMQLCTSSWLQTGPFRISILLPRYYYSIGTSYPPLPWAARLTWLHWHPPAVNHNMIFTKINLPPFGPGVSNQIGMGVFVQKWTIFFYSGTLFCSLDSIVDTG